MLYYIYFIYKYSHYFNNTKNNVYTWKAQRYENVIPELRRAHDKYGVPIQ